MSLLSPLLDGGPGNATSAVVIAETELTAAASTITFSAIPQTYESLRILLVGRTDDAGTSVTGLVLRFNGDVAANYNSQRLTTTDATVSAASSFGTAGGIGTIVQGGASAGRAGSSEVVVPHYTGTTFHKTAIGTSGSSASDVAEGQFVEYKTATWRSTAAVTSVELSPAAGNFAVGSHALLLGIKGI